MADKNSHTPEYVITPAGRVEAGYSVEVDDTPTGLNFSGTVLKVKKGNRLEVQSLSGRIYTVDAGSISCVL